MKGGRTRSDFGRDNLPRTYPSLWADNVRQRWGTLLLFGALSLLALLPSFALLIWEDLYAFSLSDKVSLGELTLAQAASLSFWHRNITGSFYLLAIPIFLIVSFALMRYLRLLAFQEPLFWKDDFFSSLKATWKFGLVYGLVFAALLWVSLFVAGSDIHPFLRYLPLLLLIVFLLPLLLYSLTLTPYYDLSFFGLLSRSVLLYLRHFPFTLLFLLGFVSPFFSFFIANPLIRYPLLLLFVVFLYPLLMHAWMVYCLSIYDKDINKDDFPDFYRKGMAPSEGEKNGKHSAQ